VGPFEFVIAFLSFIYALALAHLLFAWTRMIRHRRQLVFSWPHLLWMLVALVALADNWISLWDFRAQKVLALGPLSALFLFVVLVYFQCALVSPDFEGGETYDMKRFHACEGPTYITATLVMVVSSIAINFIAGTSMGATNWLNENSLVVSMLVPPVAALIVKREWMQALAPALLLGLNIAYAVVFYPVLASSS
jgi:hypothetical protein